MRGGICAKLEAPRSRTRERERACMRTSDDGVRRRHAFLEGFPEFPASARADRIRGTLRENGGLIPELAPPGALGLRERSEARRLAHARELGRDAPRPESSTRCDRGGPAFAEAPLEDADVFVEPRLRARA